MSNKVVRIAIAVVLALIGTAVLVRYVQSARDEAVAGEAIVEVLIVAQPVPRGTAGSELAPMVRTEKVPEKVRAAGAITDLATVSTLRTNTDLVPGEQVVASRFSSAGSAARGQVPAGLMTVTISLDPERALGGQIRPGDHVGLVATFPPVEGVRTPEATTRLELENILVTTVQAQTLPSADPVTADGVSQAPTGGYLITLAGSKEDVQAIVKVKELGKIWLSAAPATVAADKSNISNGKPS